MISLTIVVLIVIMAISWNRYRDILCPAVIQNVFWIISLLGLLTLEEKKYVSLETLFIVIIGSLMFQFGFLIRVRLKRKTNKCSLENAVYVPHKIQMLVLTIVCFSLFCIGFFQYYRFISSMGITTWYKAISTANLELNLPVFFDYVKKIIQFISLCYLIIYWCTDKVDRKKIRKIIIIQFFMAVLCVASVPSRNSMLFYLLDVYKRQHLQQVGQSLQLM